MGNWGPSYTQNGGQTHHHSVFGPCLLWPNGWMDEDATWYEGRPRPRPHCIRWVPALRKTGTAAPPSFRPVSVVATVAHLSYCWALVLMWCDVQLPEMSRPPWGQSFGLGLGTLSPPPTFCPLPLIWWFGLGLQHLASGSCTRMCWTAVVQCKA